MSLLPAVYVDLWRRQPAAINAEAEEAVYPQKATSACKGIHYPKFCASLQEVDEEQVNKALCALGMVEGRMQGVITVRFCLAEDMQAGDPEGVARCAH